jgi:hypothetical protein
MYIWVTEWLFVNVKNVSATSLREHDSDDRFVLVKDG